MSSRVRLGGLLRTHQGLRHVYLNARALDYTCVLIDIASPHAPWEPMPITEADALDFRTMTRGLEVFVRLPAVIDATAPRRASWAFLRGGYHRYLRAAQALGARALVLPTPRIWAKDQAALKDIVGQMAAFLAFDVDDCPVDVLVRVTSGREPPGDLAPLVSAFPRGRFGLAFDPAVIGDFYLEEWLNAWAPVVRLALFQEVGAENWGQIRQFMRICPVLLEMASIFQQMAATTTILGLAEEIDLTEKLA